MNPLIRCYLSHGLERRNLLIIIVVVASMEAALQRKRRGSYNYDDPDLRAKISHYSAENGNKATVSCFSMELGQVFPESIVHGMKSNYLHVLDKTKDPVEVR